MIELLVAGLRPEGHERPYWDALREHRLVLQRCTACERFQHYPRSVCVSCMGDALEFVESRGRGTVYTFTVIHRAPLQELRPLAPYTLSLVDLDEGVRVMSNVAGDPASVRIGLPVVVDFADVTDAVTLPIFRPVTDPSGKS
jgi:uncharacterized OB-fold protein